MSGQQTREPVASTSRPDLLEVARKLADMEVYAWELETSARSLRLHANYFLDKFRTEMYFATEEDEDRLKKECARAYGRMEKALLAETKHIETLLG